MLMPSTPAGRLEVINSLLNTEITDDHGNVIGYCEPLITPEEAIKLLGAKNIHMTYVDKIEEFLRDQHISNHKKTAWVMDNADLLCRIIFMSEHLMSVQYDHKNLDHRFLREALDMLKKNIEKEDKSDKSGE